jgi:hypothetical protein
MFVGGDWDVVSGDTVGDDEPVGRGVATAGLKSGSWSVIVHRLVAGS